MIKVNKICILINWVREIDMYKNLIKKLPKKKLIIIVNDLNDEEIERKNNTREIIIGIKKEKLNYKRYSKIYLKEKYKVLLSTGESGAKKISIISILRFIYSRSIGVILEKTKLSLVLLKFFGRPFVAGGSSSKLSKKYYPEKNLGDFVVKFPWSMDLNLREFPEKEWKDNFDIFFTHGIYDSKLINKKFKNKETLIIGYPRYNSLKSKKILIRKYQKKFKLNKNKKVIFWIPTHINSPNEIGTNITNWINNFKKLLKDYDVIVRPHTKTINYLPSIIPELKRKGFQVDDKSDRKIGELFKLSDLVFADYGGSVFSSIYLEKPTILLNLPDDSKYLENKKKITTFDLLVRKKILSLKSNDKLEKILITCKNSLKKKELLKKSLIKNSYFGSKEKINSLEKISKFLLKRIND